MNSPDSIQPRSVAAPIQEQPSFYRFLLDADGSSRWVAISGICIVSAVFLILFQASSVLPRTLFAAAILSAGWTIWPSIWRSVRGLKLDINILIVAAVGGAVLLGEWFEAALAAFLYALSQSIESYSVFRARRAIDDMLQLAPSLASVIGDGEDRSIPVEEARIGDLIRVRPGDRIPLDGKVIAGESFIDESALTGESAPQRRKPGDSVFAGTFNQDGSLEVRVSKLFPESALARAAQLVKESEANRAPIQGVIEDFARFYTPLIMLIAACVAFLPPLWLGDWGVWFYRALIILVVSCPCAMLISTPVTLMAALASATRNGVLIKGGKFLEEIANARVFAFDKTGTLTWGRPQVTCVLPLNGKDANEILRVAAAVETHSEHPIAHSIVEYARSRMDTLPQAERFESAPGRGASAWVEGKRRLVGNQAMFEENGWFAHEEEWRRQFQPLNGETIVGVSNEGEGLGVIHLQDEPRPEARGALCELRRMGAERLIMLTGDRPAAAERIVAETGVDEFFAQLLPRDKLEKVQELSEGGVVTVMLGDGVNDAPALASARIGVAMGKRGSDISLESAPVTLLTDDLYKLPWLVAHGRRARRVIAANIALALGIKFGFVIVAIGGYATMWLAVLADVGAALVVILNGLRMLKAR